jgi:hypothetical protein
VLTKPLATLKAAPNSEHAAPINMAHRIAAEAALGQVTLIQAQNRIATLRTRAEKDVWLSPLDRIEIDKLLSIGLH